MDERAAAEVLLVRAYESVDGAPWSAQDRAWADRVALDAAGADAPAETFVAQRAHAALNRLAASDPLLARLRGLRPWHGRFVLIAAALGLLVGLLVDRIGSSQHIDLLAPPVWSVIAWNLAVYLFLAWQSAFGRPRVDGLRRALPRLIGRLRSRRLGPALAGAPVWRSFVADWVRHAAPLTGARAAVWLHVAAAALALGLIGGMYLRGLVLDYRAGWQSTFLEAGTVQAWLSVLLAPASALSGIPLPDAAGIQALRDASAAHATAAPWIHLYAVQLLLLVVLPRSLLALGAAHRADTLARRFPLSLDDLYYRRLLWRQRGSAQRIQVWPYAHTPDAPSLAGLHAVFTQTFGAAVQLHTSPTVAFGGEEGWRPEAVDCTLAVALFDIGATPEAEHQGRFVRQLAAARDGPPLMLVDEAAFVRRFGRSRLAARRQAWSDLAAAAGALVVFADLHAPDLEAIEGELRSPLTGALPPTAGAPT